MPEEEEFELIPISPIRRLERRLELLEGGKENFDSSKFFSELVEIIRMNQQIVDELARANDALRIEISKLPGKLDEMICNLDELISYIKAAAGPAGNDSSAGSGSNLDPLLNKMDQLIEGNKKIVESNETMMSTMDQLTTKLKRENLPPRTSMRKLPPFKKRFG